MLYSVFNVCCYNEFSSYHLMMDYVDIMTIMTIMAIMTIVDYSAINNRTSAIT